MNHGGKAGAFRSIVAAFGLAQHSYQKRFRQSPAKGAPARRRRARKIARNSRKINRRQK